MYSLGASGAVGKPLLSLLVSDSSPYSTVYSFARRPHPSPPAASPNVEFKEIIVDFEKIHNGDATETAKLSSIPPASAVYITMGTTRAAAGSMAAFEKIDRGYVLSSARALFHATSPATLVYCSSGSSSSSSLFPYLKSKGLTEEGLANIYPNTILMRPGFLKDAQRPESRIMERLFEPIMGLLGKVSDSIEAPVTDVAKAMLRAAQLGPQALKSQHLGESPAKTFKLEEGRSSDGVVVVSNPAVLKLAKE